MSFLGKEYVYEGNEGIEAFMAAFGKTLPDKFEELDVKLKVTKDGDKYTVHINRPSGKQETVFQNGVEFDEEVRGKSCKTTVTVDGNIVTSKRKFEKGTFVIKSEYADDTMIVTVSIEGTDNKATVTFKAA